ncbi:hypothetical protein [uncultured Friedmanniella sp.]|uniref:hypothetical protein n=1 Tax=uncultured Friedmanniella sp. TaxID=335381 RepID=UPI0035CAE0DA
MTASVFRWGPLEVVFDEAGTVTAVRHDSDPTASCLTSAGQVVATTGGAPVDWSAADVGLDTDEVEVVRRSGDLRLVVRHSFAAGWSVRVTLSNAGASTVTLEEVLLTWRWPPDRPAWAVAAGAAGSLAVLAPDGAGPLLGGVLRLGSVHRIDADGLHLGPVLLEPRGRYVEQWQWDAYDAPRDFERRQSPGVPRRLDVTLDEVVTLTADDDEALVLDAELHAETVRDTVELTAAAPGRYRVEARSARGVTAYELGVGDILETVLGDAALELVVGPRTGARVVRFADVDAALVVQRALALGMEHWEHQFSAEDGLDLYGSRLPEIGPFDPKTIAFLCGEHTRTNDPEPLNWATRGVLSTQQPEPGLGIAATQVCLARLLLGRSIAPVVDHLRVLVAGAAIDPAAVPRREQAALLELEVVTMPQPGPAPAPLLARAAALGSWVGAGLRGRAVPPLPADELAHLAAVLALLPEAVSVELGHRWGASAHELARRAQAEVLVRSTGTRVGPAHGWLVLASRSDEG